MKWFSWIAAFLFLLLLSVGFIFFNRYYRPTFELVSWQMPWFMLCIGTVFNFVLAPIATFMEGLGKVKEIAKVRLIQQIISLLCIWLALGTHLKLYAPAISSIAIAIILFIFLIKYGKKLLYQIYYTPITESVNYKKEILPYQWKIAISWISGYFIFQLFNPVLFATEGAVVAGQMGMTLNVLNAIQAFAISWMTTKVPILSGFIAQRKYGELDSLFSKTLKQQLFITALALLAMLCTLAVIRHYNITIFGIALANRFIAYVPLIFMIISTFLSQYANSIAIYLRCHKQEPFLINSIVGAVLSSLSTVFLGKYFGLVGVTGGFLLITISLFPWGYYIYITKKRLWHTV